jgi:cell division GTPase FtsZ
LIGGTGSGLSASIFESLREEFPSSFFLSVCVFPHVTGENPMQNYNGLFAFQYLQIFADGVIYFENDNLLDIADSLKKKDRY